MKEYRRTEITGTTAGRERYADAEMEQIRPNHALDSALLRRSGGSLPRPILTRWSMARDRCSNALATARVLLHDGRTLLRDSIFHREAPVILLRLNHGNHESAYLHHPDEDAAPANY
jgi:hypothetical protein